MLAKPFLKWVGGKRSILPELLERLPEHYESYHEPFVGGGALFFAINPQKATLSDANPYLINTYKAVRGDVHGLVERLALYEKLHSRDHYLASRERLTSRPLSTTTAALFIYLNKTCFNGMYRVNKAGEYNVPMGDYKDPTILDETTLRLAHKALQGVEIFHRDFSKIRPMKNAFYYFDPPYHKTFSGYTSGGFDDAKHEELAKLCQNINDVGGYFMLSNSNTPFIQTLYKKHRVEQIAASRSVSCSAKKRGKENELLVRNY